MYRINGQPVVDLPLADLMSVTTVMKYLNIQKKILNDYIARYGLSTVIELNKVSPAELRTRRWFLRSEVENLKQKLDAEKSTGNA